MTSPSEEVRVECPGCGHVYTDWRRRSINLDLDPSLNDPAYLAAASGATCPVCGHKVSFETLVVEGGVFRG